ncbi:hypothetical protein J5I95_20065 [Candidatus Poribacteria bacterium]|nr:hypothetical protein [Candidatus Poribacteria bacterium]
MNKYRGSNLEDYLKKEKGISEEVSARAKKQWKALRAEASVVPEGTTKSPGDPPQQRNSFFIDSAVALITCFHN